MSKYVIDKIKKLDACLRDRLVMPSWPVIVLILLYLYLGMHLLSGRSGLFQLAEMREQKLQLQTRLDKLEQKRLALEGRAERLRANSLDLDMLDEQARKMLNVSYTNEIIIWLDEER